MKIVCLGDSLTYGYGVDKIDSWVHQSQKKTGFDIINMGINGDTSESMLYRFKMDVIFQKPDFVFMMGGSNDLIMGVEPRIVESNMVLMIKQAFDNSIEPIIGIPPNIDVHNMRDDWGSYSDFVKVAKQLEKYRELLLRYAMVSDVRYVDFYAVIEEYATIGKYNLYLDGLHLNDKGHRIMADFFSGFLMNNNPYCSRIK